MIKLDKLDLKILAALQDDGRLSNVQLAEKVGLSPSPCWKRVKRMEDEGVIRGYAAIFDQALLGQSETVLIELSLERHQGYQLEETCKQLAALPEVLEVHITSGVFDCFVKVVCNGTSGYEDFLKNKLCSVVGIREARSSFSLRCFKSNQNALISTE